MFFGDVGARGKKTKRGGLEGQEATTLRLATCSEPRPLQLFISFSFLLLLYIKRRGGGVQ